MIESIARCDHCGIWRPVDLRQTMRAMELMASPPYPRGWLRAGPADADRLGLYCSWRCVERQGELAREREARSRARPAPSLGATVAMGFGSAQQPE